MINVTTFDAASVCAFFLTAENLTVTVFALTAKGFAALLILKSVSAVLFTSSAVKLSSVWLLVWYALPLIMFKFSISTSAGVVILKINSWPFPLIVLHQKLMCH